MKRAFELDSIEFLRDDDLAGLEIRRSFYRSSSFSKHTHDTASLSTILRGEGRFIGRGTSHAIAAGQTVVIPREEVHACNPRNGSAWGYLMFHISDRYMRELGQDMLGRALRGVHFPSQVFRDSAIDRCMVRLYTLVKEAGCLLEKEATLVDIVSRLLLRHAKLGSRRSSIVHEPRTVKTAKDYLADNLEKNVSMSELSKATGVSAFHLLHVFRSVVGMPPHAYQVQMRVKEGRRLLLKGCSIVESALTTGFYDQSHFTNAFKRMVGLTPREYVVAHRSSKSSSFSLPA